MGVCRQIDDFKTIILQEIDQKLAEYDKTLEGLNKRIDEISPTVIKTQGVAEIEQKLKREMEKKKSSLALEIVIEELSTKANIIIDELASSPNKYYTIHTFYSEFVNEHHSASIEDMEFHLDVVFRRERFESFLKKIIDNRTFSRFNGYELKSFNAALYTVDILKMLVKSLMRNDASSLQLKGDVTLESALRELFSDWYNINYVVKLEDDLIQDMSPGKKALVLLRLLIGMAESNAPILIDQPEDDLDNRSIFDDLVEYIKQRKISRQIIVVTHNANIVVGGDSEQVIVANQQGKNSPNRKFKFEYRSGAIEDDYTVLDNSGNVINGVLNLKGIQTHICEVLEGGKTAFELRRNKYLIVR